MKRRVKDLLLLEGVISNIRFSEKKERVTIRFEDEGGMVAEFRNGKKARADHVRKLMLKAGERVIVVGARSDSNPLYCFGYDIQRDGSVLSGNYTIIHGTASHVLRMKKNGMFYLDDGGKTRALIKTEPGMLQNVNEGSEVTCLCYRKTCKGCNKPCKDWSAKKCGYCRQRTSERRYTALQVERS